MHCVQTVRGLTSEISKPGTGARTRVGEWRRRRGNGLYQLLQFVAVIIIIIIIIGFGSAGTALTSVSATRQLLWFIRL
jgi:hypothetical protein